MFIAFMMFHYTKSLNPYTLRKLIIVFPNLKEFSKYL